MSVAFKVFGIFLMLLICPLIAVVLIDHLWIYWILIVIGICAFLAFRALIRIVGKQQHRPLIVDQTVD